MGRKSLCSFVRTYPKPRESIPMHQPGGRKAFSNRATRGASRHASISPTSASSVVRLDAKHTQLHFLLIPWSCIRVPARPVFVNRINEVLVGQSILDKNRVASVVDKLQDASPLIIRESSQYFWKLNSKSGYNAYKYGAMYLLSAASARVFSSGASASSRA